MTREEAIQALTALPAVARISRADVTLTSVIIVECDEPLTLQARTIIQEQLQKVWPNNRCVVLDQGYRLKVQP
jgi:hypothetical protein